MSTPYEKIYENLLPKFRSYEIPLMTTEEVKEAEDKEKVKEDKAAEEKKEAVEDGMTSAEEKADETQQTPKVKVAENGQVKYENLYSLGTEGVVLQELPPLY